MEFLVTSTCEIWMLDKWGLRLLQKDMVGAEVSSMLSFPICWLGLASRPVKQCRFVNGRNCETCGRGRATWLHAKTTKSLMSCEILLCLLFQPVRACLFLYPYPILIRIGIHFRQNRVWNAIRRNDLPLRQSAALKREVPSECFSGRDTMLLIRLYAIATLWGTNGNKPLVCGAWNIPFLKILGTFPLERKTTLDLEIGYELIKL